MTLSSKRAEYTALTALILSFVFFFIALLVGRWTNVFAISAAAWVLLGSALIWLVLTIQFHQRLLAEREKLDTTKTLKDTTDSNIFQTKTENEIVFAVAQKRLKILEKWFLPVFAVLITIYQIAIGLYLFKSIPPIDAVELNQPLVGAICMAAIAFVSFLVSRYATGMSAQMQWKPLRAGGSFLLGAAVVSFLLAISLALVQFKIDVVLNIITYVIPVMMIILGVETMSNVIFDIYRPRLKGQYPRAAFDSRLLGIINEPGAIFRTAATAIDYQFGFKVSQTWFYKLIEKAIAPLILFAIISLYLMSCFVIVAPDEQVIIEHFGNPIKNDGSVRIEGPGFTCKWPWPIDIAYKYPTKKIMELSIGFVPKKYEDDVERQPLLWGKEHHEQEYPLLVASEQTVADTDNGAAPVSIIIAAVPVQYRIKDLYSFIYSHKDSEKLLECICYRELTKFAANATIEVDTEHQIAKSLFGAGRAKAKETLKKLIQTAADDEKLGVEIVFVGLQGLHPPVEVAGDYQKVIGAVQQKQAIILNAHAKRNRDLSSLAGSVDRAEQLYDLAEQYQSAEEENQNEKAKLLGHKLDAAFARASGDIFKIISQSKGYAFEKEQIAKATGMRFKNLIKAYNAAPEIFMQHQKLAALEKALKNIRKYVVVADPNDTQIFIIDLKEKLTPSLYDITGFEQE